MFSKELPSDTSSQPSEVSSDIGHPASLPCQIDVLGKEGIDTLATVRSHKAPGRDFLTVSISNGNRDVRYNHFRATCTATKTIW